MKQCNKCLEYKELTDFSANIRYADGAHIYCKDCMKSYRKPTPSKDEQIQLLTQLIRDNEYQSMGLEKAIRCYEIEHNYPRNYFQVPK